MFMEEQVGPRTRASDLAYQTERDLAALDRAESPIKEFLEGRIRSYREEAQRVGGV